MNTMLKILAGPHMPALFVQRHNPARATRRAQVRAHGSRQWRRLNLTSHALRMRDKRRAALAAIRAALV